MASLAGCCSQRTEELFHLLDASSDFRKEEDPAKWEDTESFIDAQKRVYALDVVNDVTERDVALAQEFMKGDMI